MLRSVERIPAALAAPLKELSFLSELSVGVPKARPRLLSATNPLL